MSGDSKFPPERWPQAGELDPYVQYFKEHLIKIGRWDSLEDAVYDAREVHKIQEMLDWNIKSADDFLGYASYLLTTWVPTENKDGRFIYYVLTLFYFILAMPGMIDLQTPITRTSISGDMPLMLPVTNWICGYAKRIGQWLDQPESLTATSYKSILDSPKYCMGGPDPTYIIPDPTSPTGGYQHFNHFFCRHIKDFEKRRPIAGGPETVVFPADSTYDGAFPVNKDSRVKIKGISWPISALLAGSKYSDRFAGGTWSHAFLNTFNYHRKHAPVGGKVLEAFNVEGCCYLQVEAKEDDEGKHRLHLTPHRSWRPLELKKGQRPTAPPDFFAAHADAPDEAGYQFIQTRAVVIIDTAGEADIGLVAVIPMGMAIVSSVNLSVKAGQTIKKGDEISWFEFGGSDIVVVFEQQANARDFLEVGAAPPQPLPPSNLVGQYYCTVGPKK